MPAVIPDSGFTTNDARRRGSFLNRRPQRDRRWSGDVPVAVFMSAFPPRMARMGADLFEQKAAEAAEILFSLDRRCRSGFTPDTPRHPSWINPDLQTPLRGSAG